MPRTKKRKAPSNHAKEFTLGYKKKGNDGNMWVIIQNKNGAKRWKKVNSDKTFKRRENSNSINEKNKILNNKINTWWSKLSKGQIIIIFKDNTYLFCKSKKKTLNARSKEISQKWKVYGENKLVNGIIWSNMSVDTLQHFVYYLLFKIPKKELDKILNMKKKNVEKYFITNYKKYFFKDEIESKKDYMFKQYEPNSKQFKTI